MTAIDVRVYSAADPDELLAVLDHTKRRGWTDPLSDVGGGTFDVPALHPKLVADPTILNYGNVVRLALDSTEVFGFIIEKKTMPRVMGNEDAGRWLRISGRGVLAVLESAVVYPEDGLEGNPERVFEAENAGAIMRIFFNEAIFRGALVGVSRDFDPVLDSDNHAWTANLDLSEKAGTDLLSVALRHADLAVDIHMKPQMRLQYFNRRGTDRSTGPTPIIVRAADKMDELVVDGEGVVKNTLLIEGPSGFVDRQDAGSTTTYGRREGFVAMGNAKSSAQLTSLADRILAVQGLPIETVKIKSRWNPRARPYLDFDVGDWILAPDAGSSDLTTQRVVALTIEEDDQGEITVSPELAGRRKQFETRIARWLKSIGDGSLGGAAAGASSPTTTSGTDSAIAAAIDAHEATHPHPDELADMADVDVVGAADEDVLTFESSSANWEAKPPVVGALTASAAWNPGSLLNDAITSTDVACPGAHPGAPAIAAFDAVTPSEWMIYATVTDDDQVHVDLWNRTGATVDLPAGTVRVVVFPA